MQAFKTQFTLSRQYLAECFDQTSPFEKKSAIKKWFPALLLLVGLALLMFTEQPKVAGSMLIGLAVLELIHTRFKRAWWLTRQMWGRSANSEIKLSINNEGIETQNPYTKTSLAWDNVETVVETELGIILVAKTGGRQYLSKSLFPEELVAEIIVKFKAVEED
ncbi:YcxB family protein [Agarivorans sp. B2Z047]|uniref:YcxB family protein n=1 Tax=Agarivorans sp. B2Z047 TaxID=2652721 RepID=UPI00128CFA24|nr:YcxB family protein [Agarivorans sp. B2Z047]MPW29611.1 YcxB family protein [Agarivorans sp. B2Z047]UQN45195.1 YcxB family protein [Agarivorans sp. B2Z047]